MVFIYEAASIQANLDTFLLLYTMTSGNEIAVSQLCGRVILHSIFQVLQSQLHCMYTAGYEPAF